MKITLICGVIGSGKDYTAGKIKISPFHRLKFASILRDMARNIDDWLPYEEWKILPQNRLFLQRQGDLLKEIYGMDFFAQHISRKIDLWSDNGNIKDAHFVISDFRFPYEYETIKKNFPKAEIQIYLVDYHSERYDANNDHCSEKMAQKLLKSGMPINQFIDKLTFEKYLYA